MKKLALALVCLLSVAFFASCDPEITNPNPSISVLSGDEYIQDNDVVDVNVPYAFGFVVASNPETNKDLASLVVKIGDIEWANVDLTGLKEYTHIDTVEWGYEKEIVFTDEITAVVTDAAGKTATAVINVSVQQNEQPLVNRTIEWIRKGSNLQNNTQAEMAECGLQWLGRDAFHANIRPAANCKLYVIENSAATFEGITTSVEKAAYFANLIENGTSVEEYRNISVAVTGDKTYNDVLAVVDANGDQHLVLFEKANVQTGNFGVQTTITGQVK